MAATDPGRTSVLWFGKRDVVEAGGRAAMVCALTLG
jgi:hypothetical protein